jgi:hypothetical protein
MASGCMTGAVSATGMLKSCCSPVASSSRTKPSANGTGSLGNHMRINCVAGARDRVTSGIWMRSCCCWRAVDQDGHGLDMLVQSRWSKHAATKFFRKLLKGFTYVPRVTITDQWKSSGAAMRDLLPGGEHRQHHYLNNRGENSHQPTRQRERRMQGFQSPGHAQRFLAAYGPMAQHFRPPHTMAKCRKDSSPGRTSRASQPRPNGRDQGRHVCFCQMNMLTRNKLTMPLG